MIELAVFRICACIYIVIFILDKYEITQKGHGEPDMQMVLMPECHPADVEAGFERQLERIILCFFLYWQLLI